MGFVAGIRDTVSQWWYPPVKEEVKNDVVDQVLEAVVQQVVEQAPAVNMRPFLERSLDEHVAWAKSQKDRVIRVYRTNTAGLDAQTEALALAKSIVDIVSVYFGSYGTAFGAVLGAWAPHFMHDACQFIDTQVLRGIDGWNFDKKMAAMAGCSLSVVGASYLWVPIVPMVCSIYSIKIGAEFTSRNRQFFQIKTQ